MQKENFMKYLISLFLIPCLFGCAPKTQEIKSLDELRELINKQEQIKAEAEVTASVSRAKDLPPMPNNSERIINFVTHIKKDNNGNITETLDFRWCFSKNKGVSRVYFKLAKGVDETEIFDLLDRSTWPGWFIREQE
jgi:hypothetical protein